jgi:hypothetical protein
MQLDLGAAGVVGAHPLSIAPALTRTGLVLFASYALFMLGCARLFSLRGAIRIAEAIVVIGVARWPLRASFRSRSSPGQFTAFGHRSRRARRSARL